MRYFRKRFIAYLKKLHIIMQNKLNFFGVRDYRNIIHLKIFQTNNVQQDILRFLGSYEQNNFIKYLFIYFIAKTKRFIAKARLDFQYLIIHMCTCKKKYVKNKEKKIQKTDINTRIY